MAFKFKDIFSALASVGHHPFPMKPEQMLLGLWIFLVYLLCYTATDLTFLHIQAAITIFPKHHWLILSNKTLRWAGKDLHPLSQTFFGSFHWKSLEQSCFASCLEIQCKILFHSVPAQKRLLLWKCLSTGVFWSNRGKREDFFHMCVSGQDIFNKYMKCIAEIIIQ